MDVKAVRKALKMSQPEFAKEVVNVSRETYSKYETGKRDVTDIEAAIKKYLNDNKIYIEGVSEKGINGEELLDMLVKAEGAYYTLGNIIETLRDRNVMRV